MKSTPNTRSPPSSIKEATESAEWKEWKIAMDNEESSLFERETFQRVNVCDVPKNKSILPCRWVYAYKEDGKGNLLSHKARFVVKGFHQKKGMDYEETFAPVVGIATIRAFISAAVDKGDVVHQMDIKTAFLHGKIDKEIFVECPESFNSFKSGTCFKLLKSLYGLKQASRIWYETLKDAILKAGFSESEVSACLFFKDGVYLIIYVDDILISGKLEDVTKIKEFLAKEFNLKDLGEVNYFLSMIFNRIKDGYIITQSQYIKEILIQYGMWDCNPKDIPMLKLKYIKNTPINVDKYKEILGKVSQLSRNTRPDLAITVCMLYRNAEHPNQFNWDQVIQLLHYLKKTINYGIKIRKTSGNDISAYTDADFSNDYEDRKSISGVIVYHNKNPITWICKKQDAVSLSTMEAEYYALQAATQRVLWLRRLMKEFYPTHDQSATTIYEDNEGTIKFCSGNATLHDKAMHIQRKGYFVRDNIKKGSIVVKKIATENNIADLFTKPLPRPAFEKHRQHMCVEAKE